MLDDLLVPLPAFRFFVTLDPTDVLMPGGTLALVAAVAQGGFSKVSGLGATLEVTEHMIGGRNDYVHLLPVRRRWERVTLERGIVLGPGLFDWYSAGMLSGAVARRDGAIVQLDDSGLPMVAWVFRNAMATRWTGPSLSATESAAAIESLEIAHHGLLRVGFAGGFPVVGGV